MAHDEGRAAPFALLDDDRHGALGTARDERPSPRGRRPGVRAVAGAGELALVEREDVVRRQRHRERLRSDAGRLEAEAILTGGALGTREARHRVGYEAGVVASLAALPLDPDGGPVVVDDGERRRRRAGRAAAGREAAGEGGRAGERQSRERPRTLTQLEYTMRPSIPTTASRKLW